MINIGVEINIKPLETISERATSNIDLIYVFSGRLGVSRQGKTVYLERDDIIILNHGERTSWVALKEGILCEIQIDPDVVSEFCGEKNCYFECNSVGDQSGKYDELRLQINELLRDHLQNGKKTNFSQMITALKILNMLTESFMLPSGARGDCSEEDYQARRIRQALQYIEDNYSKQISLKELAQMLYLTEPHLSRILKKELGVSFRQYVNQVRLEHAKMDLACTDKPIIRVSGDNGFSGMAIFNKIFKETFGVTPSQFRKENKEAAVQKQQQQEQLRANALKQVKSNLRYQDKPRLQGEEAIEIDTAQYKPLQRPWQPMINAGTASELLNSKVQKHLLEIRDQLHFRYVRIWGLFQEEMLIIPNTENGAFYFHKLDEVLSFLVSNGLKPFLQVGPKNRQISASVHTAVFSSSCSVASFTEKKWEYLMDSLISHLVETFGMREVESWFFEMWVPGFWDQGWYKWYTNQRYISVYRAVKKYAPGAMVGAGEFTTSWHSHHLESYISNWRENGALPDFFSYMAFPYFPDAGGKAKTRWITDSDNLLEMIRQARADMARCGCADKKLFFSTWNLTISSRNILNDTVYKGAYIIKNNIEAVGAVDMLGYWTVSDQNFVYKDSDKILFGGAGLVSKDGIRKPAYYAYEILEKLKSNVVAVGPNYIVTGEPHGSISIAYHNMKKLGYAVYLKQEDALGYSDLETLFEDKTTRSIVLRLQNVENGTFNMRSSYIHAHSGSVLDEWQRIGGFARLMQEDIAYIERLSYPKRKMQRVHVENGVLEIRIDAKANEFGLVEIFPVFHR